MTGRTLPRRKFLLTAGRSLASLSVACALPRCADALEPEQGQPPLDRSGPTGTVRLNVREMGAVGDGKTKDTLALQQALDRCTVLGGGEVFFPEGNYLTGTIALRSNTVLRLDSGAALLGSPDIADYPLTQIRWEGRWTKGHIGLVSATDAEDIGIVGKGRIVGSPEIKGRIDRQTQLRNPALIEFTNCKNVRVEDCTTLQNDMWSIHPTYCEMVSFKNVTVHGGADGIDIDSCKHVVIDSCEFATGDDCISLKSGRGAEGYAIKRATEDVRITNCSFADTHWACIGIGSETSGGIRGVHVEHCKCIGARTFAIYIKSRPGRGAYIEDIFMNDLDVSGAQQGFLRINILDSGKQDEFPLAGEEGVPRIRNFRFSNIRVKDVPVLVEAVNISPGKPLEGFSMDNVSGTCGKGIFLANIRDAKLRDINVSGYGGSLLNTNNVTGSGLKEAATLPATKLPVPVAPPAQPYSLH